MQILYEFSTLDLVAAMFFAMAWPAYSWLLKGSRWRDLSLTRAMDVQRRQWMSVMAGRNLRMVDTAILSGLQQGTAFFASTAILAIGGCFAMLGSEDAAMRLYRDLPFQTPVSQAVWDVKLLGLALIFAYSFFKFGWSYRLFNYCSIAVGAVPEANVEGKAEERMAQAERAAALNVQAGHHFNSGLRAIFVAISYMGWFLGPIAFMVSTALVLLVLIRRQFFSAARRAASASLPDQTGSH